MSTLIAYRGSKIKIGSPVAKSPKQSKDEKQAVVRGQAVVNGIHEVTVPKLASGG